MEEEASINQEPQVVQISPEEEQAEEKKWLLVYTDYGYAEVDLEKF